MRLRVAVAVWFGSAVGSIALGAALVACFDLFHSTSDILPLCLVDGQAPRCGNSFDAGEGRTDFCAWSPTQARRNAEHACAWLGACETPMGRNAFGTCMVQALLAYDCSANPDHRSKGTAHDSWDCLWQTKACADVDKCVFPKGPQSCAGGGGNSTACGTAADPTANNFSVRIACGQGGAPSGSRASGENCSLWGQTCAAAGTVAACAGSDAGLACSQDECFGSTLHWCAGGRDVGIDCASNGAQQCGGFPTANSASWVACLAESDAGACEPDASATCSNGTAVSCPSGVLERIDCQDLLGMSNACSPMRLEPPFDWTGPCIATAAKCASDSCDAGTITGCARGAPFLLDCAAQGLGACQMVTTDITAPPNAACSPP
jgi:hypothetical protein